MKTERYGNKIRCNKELYSLNPVIYIFNLVSIVVVSFFWPLILARLEKTRSFPEISTKGKDYVPIAHGKEEENEVRKTDFDKVTESPLALNTLLSKLIWKRYGPLHSFFRRVIFFFGICGHIVICTIRDGLYVFDPGATDFLQVCLVVIFIFYCFLALASAVGNKRLAEYTYDGINITKFRYEVYVEDITAPFNVRKWKRLVRIINENTTYSSSQRGKVTGNIITFFLFILIIPVWLSFRVIYIYLKFTYLTALYFISIMFGIPLTVRNKHIMLLSVILVFPSMCCFLLVNFHGVQFCLFTFLGVLFNIEYLMPYIITGVATIFFTWNFWNVLENNYFSLKIEIFELCEKKFKPGIDRLQIQHSDHSSSGDDNTVIVWACNSNKEPFISNILYHKIRKTFLPYSMHLFHFVLKCLVTVLFVCVVFKVNSVLGYRDDTSIMRTIAVFGVSALPHIFNVFGLRKSKDKIKLQKAIRLAKIEETISTFPLHGVIESHQIDSTENIWWETSV